MISRNNKYIAAVLTVDLQWHRTEFYLGGTPDGFHNLAQLSLTAIAESEKEATLVVMVLYENKDLLPLFYTFAAKSHIELNVFSKPRPFRKLVDNNLFKVLRAELIKDDEKLGAGENLLFF